MSCGDGRNVALLCNCGLSVCATEITEEAVQKALSNLSYDGINDVVIKTGHNGKVPYSDNEFDYLVSWNVCYYISEGYSFSDHVREYARVLKRSGLLILSIPKKSSFIFDGSEKIKSADGENLAVVRNDPYKFRNGTSLYIFNGEEEIKKAFSPYFGGFVFGSVHDDCFGFNYHWHICVCAKL
jgi:SAM-dependent methyltransferase